MFPPAEFHCGGRPERGAPGGKPRRGGERRDPLLEEKAGLWGGLGVERLDAQRTGRELVSLELEREHAGVAGAQRGNLFAAERAQARAMEGPAGSERGEVGAAYREPRELAAFTEHLRHQEGTKDSDPTCSASGAAMGLLQRR